MKKLCNILLAIFFVSCTSKIENPKEKESLLYTQKFVKNEFLVMALYLNPNYPEFTEENRDEIAFCIFPKTKISNAKIANIDAKISDLDPKIKLNFATKWSKCYKASVNSQNLAVLKFSFNFSDNSLQHQVLLSFQKFSKSLYWNQKSLNK